MSDALSNLTGQKLYEAFLLVLRLAGQINVASGFGHRLATITIFTYSGFFLCLISLNPFLRFLPEYRIEIAHNHTCQRHAKQYCQYSFIFIVFPFYRNSGTKIGTRSVHTMPFTKASTAIVPFVFLLIMPKVVSIEVAPAGAMAQ